MVEEQAVTDERQASLRKASARHGSEGQQVLCHRTSKSGQFWCPSTQHFASRAASPAFHTRALLYPNDVIEIWLALSLRWERGREYKQGKGKDVEKGFRAGPASRAVRVCLRAGLQPEKSTEEGGTFLFSGDIYLGAGGRRGPHFA